MSSARCKEVAPLSNAARHMAPSTPSHIHQISSPKRPIGGQLVKIAACQRCGSFCARTEPLNILTLHSPTFYTTRYEPLDTAESEKRAALALDSTICSALRNFSICIRRDNLVVSQREIIVISGDERMAGDGIA